MTIGGVYRYTIVACYAHFGQIEKAKSEFIELEKVESGMSLAILQQYARRFKEKKDRNHYMDGFKKAGVPEFPYGFESDKENMLSTEEIGKLLMGKIQTGYISDTSMADWDKNRIQQWWMHYREDGTCNISGFWEDSCVYRFEDNKFYVKFKEMNDAKWFGWLIFRSPDGTPKELNEYVAVGQILVTFSVL